MRAALAVVLLALVAGAGAVAWYLAGGEDEGALATAAADAFVSAWSAQDWQALGAVVGDPAAAEAHAAAADALAATAIDVTLVDIDLATVAEGSAAARYRATHRLEGLGDWTYEGDFEVVEVPADAGGDGDWAVAWAPSVLHPRYEDGLTFGRTRFWPARAPLTGSDGVPLAAEGDVVVVGIEPRRVDDADALVAAVEELTPAPGSAATSILERDDLRDDWFYPVVSMAREAYDAVREELRPVPGLVFQEQRGRTGASEAVLELVGRVDDITGEQLEALGEPYREGDLVGRTGLEASLERRLAGAPGGAVVLLDAEGAEVATLEEFPVTEPEAVAVTVDPAVQEAAAAAMDGVDTGALVAVDIGSGAVRAAVSRPSDGFGRAFAGSYPPGSTFKVVTAAALLEAGLGPADTVPCPGTINVGGRSFRNAQELELGATTFETAFAESCNTAFIGAAAELPPEALGRMAARFGFGAEDGHDYEVGGHRVRASFPPPADAAGSGAAAIGQGRVLAGPVHMASVLATAVTGTYHRPYLLEEEAGSGEPALDEDAAATLRDLLRAAVATGTGTAADVGGTVGKTGTAEHEGGEDHAWFAGVAGDLAFAVLIEEGGAGGAVAAPVAGAFVSSLAP